MSKTRWRLFGGPLYLLLLLGCESPGRLLDPAIMTQIQNGETTRAEVLNIFGEPNQVTRDERASTLFLYERVDTPVYQDPFSGPVAPHQNQATWRTLSVLFDSSDRVTKHLFSESKPDLSPARSQVGRHFTQDDLVKITPRKTTAAEMTSLFGAPTYQRLTLDGDHLLVWVYLEAYRIAGQTRAEGVEALVDEKGVVTAFRTTTSDPAYRK